MSNYTYRYFKDDEVYNIIRRALKNKPGNSISHSELLKTAKEFGLNENDIEHAINIEESILDEDVLKSEWLKKEQSDFKNHFGTFAIMMIVIFLVNLFTGGPWWFQWALLGWGIGMAFHFKSAYFPTEAEIEKGVKKLKKKKDLAA
jgi:hypothetical protein